MAQVVATHGAVLALIAVQACFRRAPGAPPETLAGEAALPPLYLHGTVLWDEHHKKCDWGREQVALTNERGSRTWTA
jgi:hypothetical protein